MRSIWKKQVITNDINKTSKYKIQKENVNQRMEFYDGRKRMSFIIKGYMLLHRASYFVLSKFTGGKIHVKKKKKK